MFKSISNKHGYWNHFSERFDWVLNNAISIFDDQNSNVIHGKMQYNDTHDDVIFTQIREKYKKDENIFDLIANKIFPYSIYF